MLARHGRLQARHGSELVAGPGERVTRPGRDAAQVLERRRDEAHFVCEVRPALQFEQLIETMFALAADGKTNRKGMPNPLRLAVIARRPLRHVRLPFPPAWMQRAGLALGAPLGRLLGYRRDLRAGRRRRDGGRRCVGAALRRRLFWAGVVLAALTLALAGWLVGAVTALTSRRARPA